MIFRAPTLHTSRRSITPLILAVKRVFVFRPASVRNETSAMVYSYALSRFRPLLLPSPGDVLQVSGEAHIVYGEDAEGGGGTLTGKHVRVDVRAVVEAKQANPLRMIMKELSPFNPPLPASSTAVGFGDGAGLDQSKQAMHLMRCREVLDVATGVKAFRFEPAALNAAGKDGDSSLAWTPGQVRAVLVPGDNVYRSRALARARCL